MRPEARAQLVAQTNEETVSEYEELIANRAWRVPGLPLTSTEDKADKRLAKLQAVLFPNEMDE
jgi:hypothetical protein